MKQFVVDNSVVMAWAFDDEDHEYSDRILMSLQNARAFVPVIWPLEAANVLAVAERKGRLTESDSLRFLALVEGLPLELVPEIYSAVSCSRNVLSITRDFGLSAYDASYLSLAINQDVPLATQDTGLRAAARQAAVSIWCE